PRSISNDELADDERVAAAVTNHKTRIKKGRKAERLRLRDADSGAELVYISGDGVSGDGGSGDGGSGDGGSGDGGSGDGGSGDGGSGISPMFRIVEPLGDGEKPWGVMDLWDHPYDPEWLTWQLDDSQVPYIVKKALNYSQTVSVAILDTGVNYTHPDLVGSIAGGVDMVGTDSGIPMDNHGHGTHVAGTIVSQHAGVTPGKANIYAVRILNDDGSGEVATLLMGLEWAIKMQMDIISMSVSYREDNPAVRQAVAMAHQYGIIMVSAAGNHSNWEDNDTSSGDGGSGDGGSGDTEGYDPSIDYYPVMYPAAYPEVIAVGAMDTWEAQASFSNDGPEVDVLAPGVDIMSTVGANSYALCNGTSMAAPHVTAAVVLIDSLSKKYNANLTPNDIKFVLNYTAVNGVIDLEGALNMIDYYFGGSYYDGGDY
ncbi:MAG: S8 family peptidase, partial [Desulfobacterales bacterium]